MLNPLVSILIPAYNQERYIVKAVESALSQDYENLEIIIGDDCSDDDTEKTVSELLADQRVKYVRNAKNLGRVGNYHNLLYHQAKGDWVVNMDGDDTFSDMSFISSSINLIQKYNEENIVFLQAGHIVVFEDKADEIIRLPKIEDAAAVFKGYDYVLKINDYEHFSHLATIYKKEAALKLNFYTADILSTDMESLLRLALCGNVILVKKPIGKWLHHGSNASTTSGMDKLIKNLVWIENVCNYAKTLTDKKDVWNKWERYNLKLQLTGIFTIEAESKDNFKDKFKLLMYFWHHFRYLFFSIYFLKKVKDAFLKR